jgi:hypothetical protein
MAFGRKVTIYLADGAPSGIRHVEIANWSGQAIACPRRRLNELKDWSEAQRPGVYFLLEKQTASYAAVLVAGTSRSGPQSWIDENGRSLKAVEEILLAET